jgi:phytoene desaturase
VGAGLGGLAAAIRLRARGFHVTVLEGRERPGGRAYQLRKSGYTFDMGPTLITAPFLIDRLFTLAGRSMSERLSLVPLDPFYRVYFHDGSFLDYTGNAQQMKGRMAERDPEDARRYDDFFRAIKPIYKAVMAEGLGATPFLTWGSMLRFAPRALRLGALAPVYSFAARYFRHEFHRFLFSFHPLFIGGSPFRVPSIYIMIPYLEREGGVWFAKGGMYSVVEALAALFREMGGEIETGAKVEEILIERGRAWGVRANGGMREADVVVSNADVPTTYGRLIDRRWRRKWTDRALRRLRLTMSCFLLYLGVRRKLPKLAHHTLVLGRSYRSLVSDIMDRKVLTRDFSLYLHAPARTDPTLAPPGRESLYVLVPVPNLEGAIEWGVEADRFQERILERLADFFGLPGFRDDIEVLERFTPLDFETQLLSRAGNAFGIEPRLSQSAYFRPHNRSEDVERLYFVGAGTHPGGGIPGVLLSAEATERCILEDAGHE